MRHLSRATRSLTAALLLGTLGACSTDDETGVGPGAGCANAQNVLEGTLADCTLISGQTYTLRGFVYVPSGRTLTIQPGVKVVGDTTAPGSALFVLRGADIVAQGTATQPIVFTSARSPGNRAPGDWGGLIIVGNGRINRAGDIVIEGSTGSVVGADPLGVNYGNGTDNADNSGILRYVRVEFAGYATANNQELNSFTFAGVGSGTTVEYVQALAGLDDAFEWFGGAVNGKYLVSYETGDDHFDASEGYVGRNQFMIALSTARLTPRPGTGGASGDPQGFEVDGCDGAGCTAPAGASAQSATPYTMPVFANFTVVGPGNGPYDGVTSGANGAVLRRGTGGEYVNGVIARWPRAGLDVRDTTSKNRFGADSLNLRNLLLAGNCTLASCTSTVAGVVSGAELQADGAAVETGTQSATELFTAFPASTADLSLSFTASAFDWTPKAGSAALTGGLSTFPAALSARAGSMVTGTAYRGAAPPSGAANASWWAGWTVYARN